MEEQMEKLVKEKEEAVKRAQTPMDIVPLVTRVSTSAITLAIGAAKGVEQLVEVVHNLSIQTGEIKKLQNEFKELQHMKTVVDTSHAAELQRAKG